LWSCVIDARLGEEEAVIRPIGQWRRERLQTIRELADRAGVSTRTVLRIEHGMQIPQLGTIKKLAAALDVDPREVREFRAAMGISLEGNERP
jgi:transcriptional regulator with XRE-family HTH domain